MSQKPGHRWIPQLDKLIHATIGIGLLQPGLARNRHCRLVDGPKLEPVPNQAGGSSDQSLALLHQNWFMVCAQPAWIALVRLTILSGPGRLAVAITPAPVGSDGGLMSAIVSSAVSRCGATRHRKVL